MNKGLTDHEKDIYKEIKAKEQAVTPVGTGFRTNSSTAENTIGVAAPERDILYVDEDGLVRWCSQQRGTPGIPLHEYTHDDMDREYITEKWCAPTCTIQCVHQVGHLDAWRDPQISLNDYNNRKGGKGLKKETVARF